MTHVTPSVRVTMANAIRIDRRQNSTHVIDVLSARFIPRGVPDHVRSDNGPEFVATAVRDWITAAGARTAYIEPGSPWENGYCESFSAKLRDELLNGEIFYRLAQQASSSRAGADPTPPGARAHRRALPSASSEARAVAGHAIRSRCADHPDSRSKTRHAPRPKPDRFIGAGQPRRRCRGAGVH